MSFTTHLNMQALVLRPTAEWPLAQASWRMISIAKGVGYWIGSHDSKELTEGTVLLVSPKSEGVIRASQLGDLELKYYSVSPDMLGGVLTAAEREHLEAPATMLRNTIHIYPPTHAVGKLFTRLREETIERVGMAQRCQMLSIFALAFPEDVDGKTQDKQCQSIAYRRFKDIVVRMPEKEFLNYDTKQLAKMCGCSVRHFTRLFCAHFGHSFREKETQLRMEKARQLLKDTDSKIIHVAMESGYRHLGLFNSTFKRYFGETPSGWRKRKVRESRPKRKGLLFAMLAGLLLLPQLALMAQTQTNSAPAKPRVFEVNRYDVQGNTILSQKTLDDVLNEHTGKEVTFDVIREAVSELQLAYRGRGFVTVSVTLPTQTLTNGAVKVQVIEGKITEIEVVNNRHFSSNNIMRMLPSLRTNTQLNNLTFQQELDRANGNRDRQIYPQLSKGAEFGESKLTLKVKDRLPLHARTEINNYGTPGTPELRINSSGQYNNLWQLDHQMGFQYGMTPQGMKNADPPWYRFYDKPLVSYYSGFYRLPLQINNDRATHEFTASDFGYDEVSKRFRPPALAGMSEVIVYASRASIDSGVLKTTNLKSETSTSTFTDETFQENLTVNESFGARLIYPLRDMGPVRSSISLGLDFKSYRLSHYETNVISVIQTPIPNAEVAPPRVVANAVPAQQPAYNTLDYMPLALSWSGSMADKYGNTTLSLNNNVNIAGVFDGSQDFRRARPKATGNYYIGNYAVSREQRLYSEWMLYLRADGQFTTEPQISNEQFGLGGNAGVRGYRDGQEYGDTGWRVLIEPRTPYVNIGLVDGTMPLLIRGSIFTDYGKRYMLDTRSGKDNRLSLWGAGFGITASVADRVDFRLSCSWALEPVPGVRRGHNQIGFSMSAQF